VNFLNVASDLLLCVYHALVHYANNLHQKDHQEESNCLGDLTTAEKYQKVSVYNCSSEGRSLLDLADAENAI